MMMVVVAVAVAVAVAVVVVLPGLPEGILPVAPWTYWEHPLTLRFQ